MSHKKGNMDISFAKTDISGKTDCSSELSEFRLKEVVQKCNDVKEKIFTDKIVESTSNKRQNIELNVKSVKVEKVLTCN